MKTTWDIVVIINVPIYSRQTHICVKFEVSNANISAVMDLNATSNKKISAMVYIILIIVP